MHSRASLYLAWRRIRLTFRIVWEHRWPIRFAWNTAGTVQTVTLAALAEEDRLDRLALEKAI